MASHPFRQTAAFLLAGLMVTAAPSLAQGRRDGNDRGDRRDSGERARPRDAAPREESRPRAEAPRGEVRPRAEAPRAEVRPRYDYDRRYDNRDRRYDNRDRRYDNRDNRPRYVAPRAYSYRSYSYRPYVRSYAVPFGWRPYGYRPGWSFNLYFGRPYGYGYPAAGYGYYSIIPGRLYGSLRIVDAPRDAQVFVDGYYAGIVDDYDGVFQHLNLESGPHHIEVALDGYEPVAFDVRIEPGETLTYHANLY